MLYRGKGISQLIKGRIRKQSFIEMDDHVLIRALKQQNNLLSGLFSDSFCHGMKSIVTGTGEF